MESDLLAWCLKARVIIESKRTIRKGGWFEAPPMEYMLHAYQYRSRLDLLRAQLRVSDVLGMWSSQ